MTTKKKTDQEFKEEIFGLVGNEYVFIDKYVNNRTKIKCIHNVKNCMHEYLVSPTTFTDKKSRCPKCSKVQKTNEDFIKEVFDLVGNEYEFLDKYTTGKNKIRCMHKKENCNHIWEMSPGRFLDGNRCPKCAKHKKSNDVFTNQVKELVGTEYTFIEDYQTCRIKINCKHNECGYIWSVLPSNFINGSRCPVCCFKESKGSKKVAAILDSKNISYQREKKFDGCISQTNLRFDFFFEINGVQFCIEYDGKQHFLPVEAWGGETALKSLQERDLLKNKFCQDNDINLLRIPYTTNISKFEDEISKFINKRSTTNCTLK